MRMKIHDWGHQGGKLVPFSPNPLPVMGRGLVREEGKKEVMPKKGNAGMV
ncbi:MAG: hypothetical protein KC418_07435 [Anaerolineales bacterium]|nr:hypothetical protein [Anaerolineales bacterium]